MVCSDRQCYTFSLEGATEREVSDWFKGVPSQAVKAYIEKVWAMPGNGSVGMFKFGMSYGFLRGCLIAHGIAFDEVPPQRWQKGLGIVGKKRNETKPQFKRRLRQKAEQLYPDTKFTSGTADAALLATYCQQEYLGL